MEPEAKSSLDRIPGRKIKVLNYNKAKVKISQNKTVKSIKVNGNILPKRGKTILLS